MDSFTYRVSDGCDTRTATPIVRVKPPPTAVNDFVSVRPGETVNLRPLANDRGGADGAYLFVYVCPTNDSLNAPPVAVNDSVLALPNTATLLEPLLNDSDPNGDPLVITGFSPPAHGRVLPAGAGHLIYKPDPGFTGADSIPYSVSDGRGGTANAVISITVPGQFGFERVVEGGTNFLQITLPAYATPLALQTASNLVPPVLWVTLTNTPTWPGAPRVIRVPMHQPQQYFRLAAP